MKKFIFDENCFCGVTFDGESNSHLSFLFENFCTSVNLCQVVVLKNEKIQF